ncbi:hypothetical protein AAG906_014106 [Vitis piasezkii]
MRWTGQNQVPFLARWPPAPSLWASGVPPALPEWRGHHWDHAPACPRPNATIDPSPMSYTSKVENSTFLFDCWQYEDHPGSYGFTCEMDDLQRPSYFVVNTSLANELGSKCAESCHPCFGDCCSSPSESFIRLEEEEECGECVESGGGCG